MSSQTRKIRYGVVGLGHIAQVAVLPAFEHAQDNSELVALISSDTNKLRALAPRYGASLTGSSAELDRLLETGQLDALYVATPNSLHRSALESAARAGVHVLCEKPLAFTVADCERMLAAAAAAKIKLMTAYRLHFEQANLRAIERIRAGEIGTPRYFNSSFSQQVRAGDIRTRADLGGGALFDLGVYCVNAARYLFRAEPIEVIALCTHSEDPRFAETDETTCAVLRFPNGQVAQFVASQGAAAVQDLRVVGTLGDLRLEGGYGYHDESREYLTIDGKTSETITPAHDQFAAQLRYFSRCILEDLEPVPSGEEGTADVKIMEALLQSAALGKRIPLTPSTRQVRPDASLEMRIPPVARVEPINANSPNE